MSCLSVVFSNGSLLSANEVQLVVFVIASNVWGRSPGTLAFSESGGRRQRHQVLKMCREDAWLGITKKKKNDRRWILHNSYASDRTAYTNYERLTWLYVNFLLQFSDCLFYIEKGGKHKYRNCIRNRPPWRPVSAPLTYGMDSVF